MRRAKETEWGKDETHLTGRVDDVELEVLALVLDRLGERVLDGRVVAVDKVLVDKLHRERRLACEGWGRRARG